MFEQYYAQIMQRLRQQRPANGFEIEHLFTRGEWLEVGDGKARQKFGRHFGRDVDNGVFPGVTRNPLRVNPGGNEARYNYDPEQDEGAG